MEEEPSPISCITEPNEEYKICEGFQSPGVENLHQNNLLLCGQALQSLNDSIEIDKCPLITAPKWGPGLQSRMRSGSEVRGIELRAVDEG